MDVPTSTPSPPTTPLGSGRSDQLALGVLLALLFGLLALRGYGNSLGVKPTEPVLAARTDLNRADRAELEQVPGIGPGLAKKIDDHRRAKGPFKSVEELRQVKGIGPATLDKVRAFVRVEPTSTPTADPSPEPLVLERRPAATPPPRSTGGGGKLQPGDPPVNVNAAEVTELMRIPGVGPVTAQNIVKARTEKSFESVADLDRVKGIGPKTLEKIRPYVVVK
jgi:competence protein ComEA